MLDLGKENFFDIRILNDLFNRNFLDEISYEIVDWLRDEEAKYQADILAREVQTYVREATPPLDAIKAAVEGAGKKAKAATGKSIFKNLIKIF